MRVRRAVFIDEQKVPEQLEWDGLDADASHWLAEAPDGTGIGTVRLLPSGQIGRMCVLPEFRRRGIGQSLLNALLDAIDVDCRSILFMHAQLAVVDFYRPFGFTPEGDTYEEAGIPHINLVYRND